MWVSLLTIMHTGLCLIAVALGGYVAHRLAFGPQQFSRESAFLYSALAATLTGFGLPFLGVTPAVLIGVVSSIVLVITIWAKARLGSGSHLWQVILVVGLLITEYLLVFVTVAQAFTKIAALHMLAPTLKETPFVIAQGVVLLLLATMTTLAVRRLMSPKAAKHL